MIIKKNTSNILHIFLVFHLMIWTLIPTFSNLNLPLDTIEALAWGSNLDWGFNKHPPFSALAVEIFYQIFGSQDWAYYLLSQLFVIVAFYVVYKFSEIFLNNKTLALFCVFLLEGILFYNFTTPEFNVNISQLPFWALSIYFAWRCSKYDKLNDYVFLGVFIGLGILSKYLFVYLAVGITLYFIYLIQKRKRIPIRNYSIASFVAVLILTPHLIWLVENNYSSLTYGFDRTGGVGSFLDHFIYPSIFLAKQIVILLPFLFMGFFLIKKIKLKLNLNDDKLIFLFFTTLIPLILVFLTSLVLGIKIRTMWMTPFYLFFGVLMIYVFRNMIKINNLKKFFISFIFLLFLSPLTYLGISLYDDSKRTDYPGKEIARLVQNKWDNNFINEIKLVIGDEWYAGNLSYHISSRPEWTKDLKDQASKISPEGGVIYVGNPKILKEVCPGVFGTIKPVGYCMIGQK